MSPIAESPGTPTLSIHPEAQKSFDRKAQALAQQVTTTPLAKRAAPSGWRPDVKPSVHLQAGDILGPVTSWQRGPNAEVLSTDTNGATGLRGAAAEEFFTLIEAIKRALRPAGAVSLKSLLEAAMRWLFNASRPSSLVSHCVDQLSPSVKGFSVLVPIADLYVQAPFDVGRVRFCEMEGPRIQSWFRGPEYDKLSPQDKTAVDEHCTTLQTEMQGYAVGVVEVVAEPEQARELGLELVSESLDYVRFFSPHALSTHLRSYCLPRRQEHRSSYVVAIERDGTLVKLLSGLLDPNPRSFPITPPDLQQYMDCGLRYVGQLLLREKLSAFQERLLSSLRMFSQACLQDKLEIRLVLALASLEAILLKDTSEPIQANLGDRIAFLAEKAADKRRAVAELTKEVYARRSRFVHHAQSTEDTAVIAQFMRPAWLALVKALDNGEAFSTVPDFLYQLDGLKYK